MRIIKLRYIYRHRETSEFKTSYTTIEQLESEDSWQGATPWELVARDEWTGLKDKNGNEIFEGDIVKQRDTYEGNDWKNDRSYPPEIGQIKYVGCAFMFLDDSGYVTPNHLYDIDDQRHTLTYEVIGNIYKNPELLQPSSLKEAA